MTTTRRASLPSVLSALALAAFLAGAAPPAAAQRVSLADLQAQIAALQAQVNAQAAQIVTLQSNLSAARAELDAVKANSVLALDQKLTYDDATHTALFTGVNVQVTSGAPLGVVNGRGNLIVGLNTPRDVPSSVSLDAVCSLGAFGDQATCQANGGTWAVNHKSGSHNLVVGEGHAYSAYGGALLGAFNAATANYSVVTGGFNNLARGANEELLPGTPIRGSTSSVSGGATNIASGLLSSVSGGLSNTASGQFSSVSGGGSNSASGGTGSVSGGFGNTASGGRSSVSGGGGNTASGFMDSVSGGSSNTASGGSSSVSGGLQNTASGAGSSVSGGENRSAPSPFSGAAGGLLEPN